MKAIYMAIFSGLVLAMLTNCAKKDDGPKATNEMSAGCFMAQTQTYAAPQAARQGCNFNYSATPGFTNYGSNMNYTSGYYPQQFGMQQTGMGCSSGAQAYSPTKGLGCVDSQLLQAGGTPAVYSYDAANFRFVLASTAPAVAYNPYGYNTGYNNPLSMLGSPTSVVRVCDSTEVCPTNQRCVNVSQMATGFPGAVGLCYF